MAAQPGALEAAYPRFAEQMTKCRKCDYDWNAYEVTTEDGYILTTFVIPS